MWCVQADEWLLIEERYPRLIEKLAGRIDWEPSEGLMFTLDGRQVDPEGAFLPIEHEE
jgi:hypothetical protein